MQHTRKHVTAAPLELHPRVTGFVTIDDHTEYQVVTGYVSDSSASSSSSQHRFSAFERLHKVYLRCQRHFQSPSTSSPPTTTSFGESARHRWKHILAKSSPPSTPPEAPQSHCLLSSAFPRPSRLLRRWSGRCKSV